MKRTVCLLVGVLLFLAPAVSALAWGDDGHQTVGKIASLRIKPQTAIKIALILKPGETLANIASWADTVKYRIGKTDPDAILYGVGPAGDVGECFAGFQY